jgi:leucyl aminopeptidase
MPDKIVSCVDTGPGPALPIHIVRPATLAALLAELPAAQSAFVTGSGFTARAGDLILLPGPDGVASCLFGIGAGAGPHVFGSLPFGLPEGSWRLVAGDYDADDAVLGFCLGAYRYTGFKQPSRPVARLRLEAGTHVRALSQAAATWMVRDLINAPANLLGPSELADAAVHLAQAHNAIWTRIDGAALDRDYPTIAAVGRGSERRPVVVAFTWRGHGATANSPLISLCGKGVCFDTGGYDLKPSSGMLRMKKDMGGAAAVLGMARMMMEADLPIRLAVRIGCVENSVSGHAMRPQDVIRTRRGLTVEVGNTDAEGRLVLCDLLAEASDEAPDLLLNCATLTGAARVAVGPDLPALFSNDDELAERLLAAGTAVHDPMWRLPLWDGYDKWLDSPIADLNNVAAKPMAGAVVAALFLRRFVSPGVKWAHLDMYAYNDITRPARPEGGEAQAVRAVFAAVESMLSQQ